MDVNRILRRITYEIYQCRPATPQPYRTNYRIERANSGLLCDLWFLTTGCMHDAKGGCVMCNYGKGCYTRTIDQERILAELEQIVNHLPWTFEDFLLTSSGSMLDKREVSQKMRERLIPILRNVKTKRFAVETRIDTVTSDGFEFIKEVMPQADEHYIEIGLESSNNWVLKHCINKAATFECFCEVVKQAHAHGILVTVNVGLGFPFMSERASIGNTIQTIRDTLKAGVDSVVVFPYHIKHWTLLDVMYRNGIYDCVSLWALVKVLETFPQNNIQVSWYKDYFGESRSYIYRSPKTCDNCFVDLMKALDTYREDQRSEIVAQINNYSCKCREDWENSLALQSDHIEIQTVENMYRRLATLYSIDIADLEQELSVMKREYKE